MHLNIPNELRGNSPVAKRDLRVVVDGLLYIVTKHARDHYIQRTGCFASDEQIVLDSLGNPKAVWEGHVLVTYLA